MPALDSRIGDLAQCYGRFDEGNKWYEMQLIVNSNEGRYGWKRQWFSKKLFLVYKIIRLCISIFSGWGDAEVINRHGHGFQHRVREIIYKSNCLLNLGFDDMDNKVIFDEEMLFKGKVFCLLVVFEILANVVGERWVFFDLFQDCDVLNYSFLGLCLDKGAVIVGTQDCDIAWVRYGNGLSDG